MPETSHEKFLRLAEKRVPKALDAIRLVGQLSSTNYSNTDEEADEIIGALEAQVAEVRANFGRTVTETAKLPLTEVTDPELVETSEQFTESDAAAGNPED